MKKYNYNISTNTIWTSFDYGTVEAENIEEARKKALEELKHNFKIANTVLGSSENTSIFRIYFDFKQIQITEA